MAVRSLNLCICLLLCALLTVPQAYGCFGPKLFVGAANGAQNEVLYALVTLYVKEKTGVESTLVVIDDGHDPLELIADDKADLVFVPGIRAMENTVLQVGAIPVLVTGKRPLDDLQFTTVLPAVRKLNGLLSEEDVTALVEQVKSGQSAMSAVRKFFMERRWI